MALLNEEHMKNYILLFLLLFCLWGCNNPEGGVPDPHLELGQRISFVGSDPEKTYVIVGYRQLLEDKTEKEWGNQAYIVFSYTNNRGDIKVAAIHRNAVLKK